MTSPPSNDPSTTKVTTADGSKDAIAAQADAQQKEKQNPAGILKMFSMATWGEILLFFAGVIGAMGHGVCQPLVCVLFGDVINNLGGSTDSSVMLTHDQMISNMMSDITSTCVKFCYVGLGVTAGAWLQGTCFQLFADIQVKRMRVKYFEALLYKDVSWYDTRNVQALPSQFTDDMDNVSEGFGEKMGGAVFAMASFIAGYAFAFYQGWQIALVMLSILPFMAVGATCMAKAVQAVQLETQGWYAQAAVVVEECLYSMRTVVAFGAEARELEKFNQATYQARRGGISNGLKMGAGMGYMNCVIFCGYSLAFYYGMTLRYNNQINPATGQLWSPGTILSIFFCVFIGSFSIGNVGPGIKAFSVARVAAGRFFETVDSRSVIQVKDGDRNQKKELPLSTVTLMELKDVHFFYPARPDIKVLAGVSLNFKKGQKVALVGESGSGKSTVIALLERFYDPAQGQVLVNGEDARSFSVRSLRKSIAYVGQEPVLFATSIEENIKQGNPGASEADFQKACKDAQLTFVDSLPEGYKTFVGSGGSQFSGGQKQRIAIARALIKNATFLLLDEATSALDNRSEKMIQATIDSISAKKDSTMGIISIAHRLSTVKNCDIIYVMKAGKLMESGNHEALMKAEGLYCALVASQDKKKEDDKSKFIAITNSGAVSVDEEGEKLGMQSEAADEETAVGDKVMNATDQAAANIDATKKRELDIKKNYKVPMGRLLSFNRPEWPFFVPALIGAAASGAGMPAVALILTQAMNDFFKPKEEMKASLSMMCIYFVIIGGSLFFAEVMQGGCFAVLGEAMTQRIRVKLLKTFFSQEIGFHDSPEHAPSILGKALELYAFRVAALCRTVGSELSAVASLIVGLAAAFYYCWQMSLFMLGSIPIMIATQAIRMIAMMGASKSENKMMLQAQQIIADSLQNSRTVQACGTEQALSNTFSTMVEASVKGFVFRHVTSGFGFGLSSSIMNFVLAAGFFFAGTLIKNGSTDFLSVMTAFMGIFYAGMGAGRAAAMVGDATKAKVACHDMFLLLDRVSLINGMEPVGISPGVEVDAGTIEFRDVRFHYPNRPDVKVLKGVSFSVKSGQKIGLVGPSGGGKSTVMALLQRFYDPMEGAVLIGSQAIALNEINIRWWRQQIGFVGQEPVLFNTTVLDNVKYGLPDGESISDERLEECREMSHLDFLQNEGCAGWQTVVGPRGSRLSGGQKQRVAICRALVRNPKVLLLDEATSALDSQSEKIVQVALDVLMKGRTSFAIAHRLPTIQDSDQIFVVAEGTVLERGNHAELMQLAGVYAKLQQQAHA